MTTARKHLIDPNVPLFYHLVSGCVRHSFLCGFDKVSGNNYDHRKEWLIERIHHLAQFFAVQIYAYTIMSNHFHLALYYDPLACQSWSDEEVAERWLSACDGEPDQGKARAVAKAVLLGNAHRLRHARQCLGSLSMFMKHLKQPIARRANLEDGCSGHFFEQRFYSGALLSEESVLAAMAYVDLNPIRAKIAESLHQCEHSSIAERLNVVENTPERLQAALQPLVSGLVTSQPVVTITLALYVEHLQRVVEESVRLPQAVAADKPTRWQRQLAML
ncbi:MAG: hypothetical protein QGI81_12340, partial [Pseudomonadales bacterium]|nr:hypothetical protein [Pseudomonadales bacterium]MDP6471769.1 hypothetical protein [Pseudomonadales bacterium]